MSVLFLSKPESLLKGKFQVQLANSSVLPIGVSSLVRGGGFSKTVVAYRTTDEVIVSCELLVKPIKISCGIKVADLTVPSTFCENGRI